MLGSEPSRELAQVLERFPGRADLVARLARESELFRSLCEDYALACSTLARLAALERSEQNMPVISDYECVIAALERDIATALQRADAAE